MMSLIGAALTFFRNVAFHWQASEVHDDEVYPSRTATSNLNNMAATCEQVSPNLKELKKTIVNTHSL